MRLPGMGLGLVLGLLCLLGVQAQAEYTVLMVEKAPQPIISFLHKTSDYHQVFNPSWLPASAGTDGREGLFIRTQDCNATVGTCSGCNGNGSKASILTFSERFPNERTMLASYSYSQLINGAHYIVYQPAYVILNGSNPTQILQRPDQPLTSPTTPWEQGQPPELCNVAMVTFLEGARALGNDVFEVFYGGSDAVVGRAVVAVTLPPASE
ncbi:uncharacterized protein MONBRDRAFT_7176 [Monosiga brevicollis MX1]|uniref:Uncharacterized protein n=1 Tax=Monosiga brevicollis TaxID=81824 RepID=A9UW61_MONBE|nr:uncharacterized protein MONBRDRAFT_7176 [Monosiga brevicollis MX1]EDQ90712.1 predicted protein [Monosiga brevicollis MX1]|eukprot:XP_001744763.1 hypothetical protein [Monosiga brevicollis MX1]